MLSSWKVTLINIMYLYTYVSLKELKIKRFKISIGVDFYYKSKETSNDILMWDILYRIAGNFGRKKV